jgi:hypothetical protein
MGSRHGITVELLFPAPFPPCPQGRAWAPLRLAALEHLLFNGAGANSITKYKQPNYINRIKIFNLYLHSEIFDFNICPLFVNAALYTLCRQ